MTDQDPALQIAQLRSLLTLSRELLQSDDLNDCLELVGATLAEVTQMNCALLFVPSDGRHDVVAFDRRGNPQKADRAHPLYRHAAAILTEARPAAVPPHGHDAPQSETTGRNVLALGVPAGAPVAALAVAWDRDIDPAEQRDRRRILIYIAELALAALGKIQARAGGDKQVHLQAGQGTDSAQAHAAEVARRDVLESQMRQLSTSDVLTGLRNRRGFFLHAEQLFKVAQREQAPSAVIFADVDDLKQVNDELGRDAGDHLIRDAAEVFRESFRAADVAARFGGDEFVAYTLNDEQPGVILDRIRNNLRAFNLMRERPYQVSLSAGIVQCDPSGEQMLSDYVSLADQQMYAQKWRRLH
jgi:diguanylate cyclase (GGDEF)-like protein